MRLFLALDIDDAVRSGIAVFIDRIRAFAPDARWVRPESLHVTLKFIGEQSAKQAENIKRALETINASGFKMNIRAHGFFPETRTPRVFWIGIEAGTQLASLVAAIEEKLAALGIAKEVQGFSPHLTLARSGRGSASPRRQKSDRTNQTFQRLQEKLAAEPAPEFRTMTAREFFLYQSRLSAGGSQYTKLAGFPLR
jgi:2'-5' RNA ligase